MKHIYLVRHAQSEHHIRQMTGGWTDLPLTDRGRRESEALARWLCEHLRGVRPQLFSSDLRRAAETAGAIAAQLAAPIEWEHGLRELNNGEAAGRTLQEAERIALPATHPTVDWVPYPGAESWRMMADRVTGCLETIARGCDDTAVLVTHGNAAVAVVHWWLGLCPRCQRQASFEFDPASVTELTVNSWGERTVARANSTSHLTSLT